MMVKLLYNAEFQKKYKKLPKPLRTLTKIRLDIFRAFPFAAELRTHKLSGKLDGLWAFSVNFQIRIIFEFLERNTIHLLSIGDHSVYRRK